MYYLARKRLLFPLRHDAEGGRVEVGKEIQGVYIQVAFSEVASFG